MSTQYLDKQTEPTVKNETYTWNDKGNIITLSGINEMPKQFFVSQNKVTALDLKGNKIMGDLANKYILKKEGSDSKTDINVQPVPTNNFELAGKKFKLIEIGGMPLAQGEKTLFIQFDDSESFSAYAGCNYINGKLNFQIKKQLIQQNLPLKWLVQTCKPNRSS